MRAWWIIALTLMAMPQSIVVTEAQEKQPQAGRLEVVVGEDGKPLAIGSESMVLLHSGEASSSRYLVTREALWNGPSHLFHLEGATARHVKKFGEIVGERPAGRPVYGGAVYQVGDSSYVLGDFFSDGMSAWVNGLWRITGTEVKQVMHKGVPLAGPHVRWLWGCDDEVLIDGEKKPTIYRLKGDIAEEVLTVPAPPQFPWEAVVRQGKDILVATTRKRVGRAAGYDLYKYKDGEVERVRFKDGAEAIVPEGGKFTFVDNSLFVLMPGTKRKTSIWRYVDGMLQPLELTVGKPASSVRVIGLPRVADPFVVASSEVEDGPEALWLVSAAKVDPILKKDGKQLSGVCYAAASARNRTVISMADKADSPTTIYIHDGKTAEVAIGLDGKPLSGSVAQVLEFGKWLVATFWTDAKGTIEAFLLEGARVLHVACRPDGSKLVRPNIQSNAPSDGVYLWEGLTARDQKFHLYWMRLG